MLDRRNFLCVSAAYAGQWKFSPLELHSDYQTAVDGIEYYFLGNGKIIAAVQTVERPEDGTHTGLILMPAERFGRKHSSLLYSVRSGLRYTRIGVSTGGAVVYPEPGKSRVRWEYPEAVPTVLIEWEAGDLRIAERIHCLADNPALVRDVAIRNVGVRNATGRVVVWLQPNSSLLDEYDVDRQRGVLTASGYHRVQVYATGGPVKTTDRSLEVEAGGIPPGGSASARIVMTVDGPAPFFSIQRERTAAYWNSRAELKTGHAGLDHLFHTALAGIRAAVSSSGKMDGGIWQYNLEWARDPVMVAQAAAATGGDDIARSILERVWAHSVTDEGKTVEASRTREPADMELDQNGQVLYATWARWAWTGDDSLIRRYWKRIHATADYVLQPVFREASSGLLKNTREFWERGAGHGFQEGFEISYQVWNIIGLEKSASMAARMGDGAAQRRWLDAARLMRESLIGHSRYSLIENNRFIKRRLMDGRPQLTVVPPDRSFLPPTAPLRSEPVCYCDPDTATVYPIIHEIVDPRGEIARHTLESMEKLWNQRWSGGGYGRYDVTSEPDSPGPWPFASMFVARAWHEAGNYAMVWRVLNWMLEVQGGRGGAWFEVYGPRPLAGFPVGIVPWTWGEILLYFVHHFLGVRPEPEALVIRPRLLSGIENVEASVLVRGQPVHLRIARGATRATVNGIRMDLKEGAIRIDPPRRATQVEFS